VDDYRDKSTPSNYNHEEKNYLYRILIVYILASGNVRVPSWRQYINQSNNKYNNCTGIDSSKFYYCLLCFFGGKMGAVIGTIITIALAILIIEWIFKKPTSA